MAGDNPDWTLPVSIRSQEISNLTVDIGAQSLGHLDIWFTGQTQDMNVNITNSTLDVNVTNSQINANITNTSLDVNVTNTTLNVDANITNSVLNVDANVTNSVLNVSVQDVANVNITNATLDVNVTNSQINANITNTSLDVNVTNTTLNVDANITNSILNVSMQDVANVEIQNAEVNVKNLREQVISVTDLEGFSYALYANSGSAASATVYTNNNNFTVYLEYFTVAVELGEAAGTTNTLDPTVIYIEFRVKDSEGTTLFTLTANGQMFLNLDPAIPIPSGGKIEVSVSNSSTYGLFIQVGGIIRKIS